MLKTNNFLLSTLVSALAALSCTNSANAALPGYYVGGQVGLGDTHYSANDLNNVVSANVDNNNLAGRVFGGYQFCPNWAFEVGYTQFHKTKFNNVMPGHRSGSIEQYSVDGLAKGILPLQGGFNLFGLAGAAYVNADTNGRISGPSERINPAFGAGMSYDVTANVPMFVAWNHTQKWSGNIPNTDLFSVGAAYNFG